MSDLIIAILILGLIIGGFAYIAWSEMNKWK